MPEKYPRETEVIDSCRGKTGYYAITRLRVPGGWLVTLSIRDDNGNSVAVCFLPDPAHEWKLEQEGS